MLLLDKLPFKRSLLNPLSPLGRIPLQLLAGPAGPGGGGRGRLLLSYELFLTHVYNFHKSFCKGEGEEGKGRQIQFTPAEPLARWAGMGGEGRKSKHQSSGNGMLSKRRAKRIDGAARARQKCRQERTGRDTHPRRGVRRRLPESDFTLAAFVLRRHFPCSDCISFLPAPLEKAACLCRRSPD